MWKRWGLLLVALLMTVALTGCGGNSKQGSATTTNKGASTVSAQGKSLVVYYSWSGRAQGMAEAIGKQVGADVVVLVPEQPYPKDYNACTAQAKDEINNGYRPPIKPTGIDLAKYDVVYVGSPIWWGTIAPPVATFLASQTWTGKVVKPFTTHGGGGKGRSDTDIAALAKGATVKEMFTTYEGNMDDKFAAWVIDVK